MAFTKTPASGSYIQIKIGTVYTNIPGVDGIPEFGHEKSEYENTAISDATKTFGADTPDPGELVLTGSVDLRDNSQLQMCNNAANVDATDEFKVNFNSGATATFAGRVMSFRIGGQRGQDERFTSRIKISGAVTWTAAT